MKTGGKGGVIIFCLIVVIAAIAAFAAYPVTGQMGIGDRYRQAAGLAMSGEDRGNSLFKAIEYPPRHSWRTVHCLFCGISPVLGNNWPELTMRRIWMCCLNQDPGAAMIR